LPKICCRDRRTRGVTLANAPSRLLVHKRGASFLLQCVTSIDSHPAFRRALKSHLFRCTFYLSVFVFGDRYLGDGVKVCMMVRRAVYRNELLPCRWRTGDIFTGHQMRSQERGSGGLFWPLRHQFLPFDCEYIENGGHVN